MMLRPPIGTNVGLDILNYDCLVYNRTGSTVAIGTVLAFDIERTQAETTQFTDKGVSSYIFSNGILPTTTSVSGINQVGTGWFSFVQEAAIADNAAGPCRVFGIGDALFFNAANVGKGALGQLAAGAVFLNVSAATGMGANVKVPAIMLEDHVGNASAVLHKAIINGLDGFK